MVNPIAHNTIDARRHVGGLTVWGFYGANNTIEEKVGAYNTVCVRAVVEYYFCRCTGYDPWYCGLTCAPCLAFFVRSLVLSEWVSPVGWS